MPNLTKSQIEKLLDNEDWLTRDIAQTALDALQRVEELAKEVEDLHTNLAKVTKLVKFKRKPD